MSVGKNMSSKRAKFIELAEARVSRAIRDIRLIGNLSNRSAYEHNEDDIRQIFGALKKELESAKDRFGGGASGKDGDFKLKS